MLDDDLIGPDPTRLGTRYRRSRWRGRDGSCPEPQPLGAVAGAGEGSGQLNGAVPGDLTI